jgi:NIPSNAP
MTGRCGVYELRRYALAPGRRDDLIEIFDRCFIESQEELGMHVVGQFRLRGDPDAFVWIRGFSDMESRARSLQAFYGESAAWRDNRDAANATMIAFDDVLLLRPAGRASSFALDPGQRPGPDAPETDGGQIVAEISRFERPVGEDAVAAFESEAIPVLRHNGIDPLALLATEPAPNTFPQLPIREGENTFVWLAAFPDREAWVRAANGLRKDGAWERARASAFARPGPKDVRILEFEPTRRSLLRGRR